VSADGSGLMWRKSSLSADGECVEVATAADRVYVRDSKAFAGIVLVFSAQQWNAFIHGPLARKFAGPSHPDLD
jgi:Domain of unknown function (DUF397)